MKNLNLKAFAGLTFLFLVMAALLFFSTGTLNFWQGWVFLAVFFIPALASTLYLMKNDPALLERRSRAGPIAEKKASEKIIQSITSIGFIAMLIVPGLDYRFGWSAMPFSLVILGDILVFLGFVLIFFVFKENTFASGTIEIHSGQKVISTGLYSLVRHPMYMGGFVLFIGMILALGSWWNFLPFVIIFPALIWRIFDEEKMLAQELPGYTEYENKVTHRLIPFVW